MRSRLPAKIDFGVAVIYVKQLSKKEMREMAECDSEDPTPDGLWDSETETIYLGRYLSLKLKREVLFHEVIHAANDYNYWQRHLS